MNPLPHPLVRLLRPLLLAALLLLLPARAAHALQTHPYDGLYLHQIAQLFLLAARLSFALRIQHSRLAVRRPWRWMAAGAWLLALWNVWAFGGHFIEAAVPEEAMLREPGQLAPRLLVVSWLELAYVVAKLEHLLVVPAVFSFYLGLRGIHRALGPSPDREGEGGP